MISVVIKRAPPYMDILGGASKPPNQTQTGPRTVSRRVNKDTSVDDIMVDPIVKKIKKRDSTTPPLIINMEASNPLSGRLQAKGEVTRMKVKRVDCNCHFLTDAKDDSDDNINCIRILISSVGRIA
jgi:hypothetical protein